MTDCSHVVSMDAFLSQWRWGQWVKGLVKYTSSKIFKFHYRPNLHRELFLSDVIINWPRATRTVRILLLAILQWRGSMRIMNCFITDMIKNSAIWLVESRNSGRNYVNVWTNLQIVGEERIKQKLCALLCLISMFTLLFYFSFPNPNVSTRGIASLTYCVF